MQHVFDDEDAVIDLSDNVGFKRSHKKTAIIFILFAALIPVSSAVIWISIPTRTAAIYYFVKLPIVVLLATSNCFYIVCDLCGSFRGLNQKLLATCICSSLATVLSVAITIGVASAFGELQRLWIVPISTLIGYMIVSLGLFILCHVQTIWKQKGFPQVHLQVFMIMIVVHLQLVFSLVFGFIFTMKKEWYFQPILCASYPFCILVFKIPLVLIAGENVNLQITCQVLSLAFAALPYRFLFPAMSARWYVACLILAVEISYKWILFGLDLKRKVMSSPTLQAIQKAICCQSSSSPLDSEADMAAKRHRTRLNYVLFTYQTFLDCSFAIFIMVLFSYINSNHEASTQTGIPDLRDTTFQLSYVFYPLGFLVSLLTFVSIVVYHQYSYKNDNQVEQLLSWKHLWEDDSKLIKKFAVQIMLCCTALYIILLWSAWQENEIL